MSPREPSFRSHITLALCTILHAFTHAYGSLLVPLYIVMKDDLHLPGVKQASLLVTISGLVYCVLSYPAGVLADHLNRKTLLGIGLLGNAIAIAAMGFTHNYSLLIAASVLAGLFGTLFHPAANALIPEHYPRSPGMAIGLLGIGSGIGFFAGPQFAGWRAKTAHPYFAHVSTWQIPLIESGLAGLVSGILFLFIAKEVKNRHAHLAYESAPPSPRNGGEGRGEGPARGAQDSGKKLGLQVAAIAAVLGCRDFAGLAALSLASIYLQKAHHPASSSAR